MYFIISIIVVIAFICWMMYEIHHAPTIDDGEEIANKAKRNNSFDNLFNNSSKEENEDQ